MTGLTRGNRRTQVDVMMGSTAIARRGPRSSSLGMRFAAYVTQSQRFGAQHVCHGFSRLDLGQASVCPPGELFLEGWTVDALAPFDSSHNLQYLGSL